MSGTYDYDGFRFWQDPRTGDTMALDLINNNLFGSEAAGGYGADLAMNASGWDRAKYWTNNLLKPGVDPKTGLPTQSQFQGYLGNAQTAFGLGKTAFDIMGAMKYGKYVGKYVDTQRKALDQQMKVARAQMGGYYENQAARRAANSGMGTTEALAQGKQVSEEQMKRWGL